MGGRGGMFLISNPMLLGGGGGPRIPGGGPIGGPPMPLGAHCGRLSPIPMLNGGWGGGPLPSPIGGPPIIGGGTGCGRR